MRRGRRGCHAPHRGSSGEGRRRRPRGRGRVLLPAQRGCAEWRGGSERRAGAFEEGAAVPWGVASKATASWAQPARCGSLRPPRLGTARPATSTRAVPWRPPRPHARCPQRPRHPGPHPPPAHTPTPHSEAQAEQLRLLQGQTTRAEQFRGPPPMTTQRQGGAPNVRPAGKALHPPTTHPRCARPPPAAAAPTRGRPAAAHTPPGPRWCRPPAPAAQAERGFGSRSPRGQSLEGPTPTGTALLFPPPAERTARAASSSLCAVTTSSGLCCSTPATRWAMPAPWTTPGNRQGQDRGAAATAAAAAEERPLLGPGPGLTLLAATDSQSAAPQSSALVR